MSVELTLLRAYIDDRELYNKYRDSVDDKTFESKTLSLLYKTLDKLYENTQENCTVDSLEIFYNGTFSNPIADKEAGELFAGLRNAGVGADTRHAIVVAAAQRAAMYRIAKKAVEMHSRGIGGDAASFADQISNDLDILQQSPQKGSEASQSDLFVTDDLGELLDGTIFAKGLKWRLNTLNKMLGPLRKGNFGFIFARPESYSRDTEVLTPTGWLAVDKVTLDTEIAQVTASRQTEFVYPKAIHPHTQTHCYHIHDILGRVDLIVTEGHGMVVEQNGLLIKERADTVKYYQGVKHHTAAKSCAQSCALTDMERLAIAYQADGHSRNYKQYGYTFSFKKERKIQRLKNILNNLGWEYTIYKDGNRGHIGFYVKTLRPYSKDFSWVDLGCKSAEWCQEFIEELSYWDATRRTNSRFKFDTTNKAVADMVQAIATLAGYNCLQSMFVDKRSDTFKDIYSLSIRTNYQPVDGQCIIKERIPFTDTTYCFEVPSGMLVVRRNGAVAVCGNTGKTTFLASEISFMARQLPELYPDEPEKCILFLNNEEEGQKVKRRVYQAAVGKTLQQLLEDPDGCKKEYLVHQGNRIKILDSAAIHKRQVEQLCKEYKPALIVVDQIDKLYGFDSDREDLRLGAIYQWARELAKSYCPVIAVCQADGTGEGVKWLTMSHVANAKTSKQAEADFIIGIGKTHDPNYELIRHINISKNKLDGDEDTEPSMRHGRSDVIINAEIARYQDL